MTLRWLVLVALCACGLAAAPAHARTPSRAALELSSAGKKALSSRSISVPKSATFAIGEWTIGSSAKIGLTGSLRFSAGKRKVSATALSVRVSRTSSYVSARLGGKSVRLFTITPTTPAVLDAARQRVSLVGARIALTKAAAATLKSKLKLRRAPSTATLGKLTVGVAADPAQPTVVPPPAPPTTLPAPSATPEPTATPTATPDPTPTPEPACEDRFAATPAGSVDWFACDLPGTSDLHSWTDYILRPWFGCPGPAGSVVASDGAARVVASTAYDHRFPITSSTTDNGARTITVGGTVTYTLPAHGIDEAIGGLKLVLDAGGTTGTVYATGRYKPFSMGGDVCTKPPDTYANVPVLTLDLSKVTPVTADGVQRWVHVPATISADAGDRIGGGTYGPGRPWGSFTIALPAR